MGRCLGRQVFQVLTECQRAVKLDPEVHQDGLKLESVVVDCDVELVAGLSVVEVECGGHGLGHGEFQMPVYQVA